MEGEQKPIVILAYVKVGFYTAMDMADLQRLGILGRVHHALLMYRDVPLRFGILKISDVPTFMDKVLNNMDAMGCVADCIMTKHRLRPEVTYYGVSKEFLNVITRNWKPKFVRSLKVRLMDVVFSMPSVESADYTGRNRKEEAPMLIEEIKSSNIKRCEFLKAMQNTRLNHYHTIAGIPKMLEGVEDHCERLTDPDKALCRGIKVGETTDPFESLKRKRDASVEECIEYMKTLSGLVEKIQKMVLDCSHSERVESLADCDVCSQAMIALAAVKTDIQMFFDKFRAQ